MTIVDLINKHAKIIVNKNITYKRSNSTGLSIDEITKLNNSFQIISNGKKPNENF